MFSLYIGYCWNSTLESCVLTVIIVIHTNRPPLIHAQQGNKSLANIIIRGVVLNKIKLRLTYRVFYCTEKGFSNTA
jgi:hypothetical protein